MFTREDFLALVARFNEGDQLSAVELGQLLQNAPEFATDEELAQIEAGCQALGADDATPLDVVRAAVDLVDGVRTEADARFQAAAAEQAERDELRARLAGETASNIENEPDGGAPEEGGDDGDAGAGGDGGDGGDGAGAGDGGDGGDAEPPAETPEPAGEPAGEPASGRELVGATAAGSAPVRRPVTAGSAPARRTGGAPVAPPQRTGNRIVRDGGGEYANLAELGQAMVARRESFLHSNTGHSEQITIGSILAEYPEARQLDARNALANASLFAELQRATGMGFGIDQQQLAAVTAAGGFCAPIAPFYSIPFIGDTDRPFKASFTGFQATRGGITFRPPAEFADFSAAVTQWTRANDILPGSAGPATKPCLRVDCLDAETVYLYAVVECLTFGNFMAMADPETVENATLNTAVAHARKAEVLLMDAVKAESTAVSGGSAFGAYRDLLFHWGVAAAAYRSRKRMRPDAVLELRAPAWVRDMIREDVARSLNAYSEQYAIADDFIARSLAARNIRPFWFIDSPTTGWQQVMGPQPASALVDFPQEVQWQMSPPGTFLFIENGRLDLGVVRDSTLNSTNDFQTFGEDFEGIAHIGYQSYWGTSQVCPNGASAGTTAPDLLCQTGSDYIPTGSGVGAFSAP